MAQIRLLDDTQLGSGETFLVEGLPGVGLVGQIAVGHLVEELGLETYAAVDCNGLPQVSVFSEGEHEVSAPVRLFASEGSDVVVLQSDVPVSAESAGGFADCLVEWLEDEGITPVFTSGLPVGYDTTPSLYGVSAGDGDRLLGEISPPEQGGVMSGPTGALLKESSDRGFDAVGLIAESDQKFPDPAAARIVIEEGIAPITGIDVDTSNLVEKAEEITKQKERLAKKMREAEEESTTATPTGMYH